MTITTAYDYRRLTDPTEDELNRLGAEGFYIVANYLDPKATYTQVVIMQREQQLELVTADEPIRANSRKGRGNGHD